MAAVTCNRKSHVIAIDHYFCHCVFSCGCAIAVARAREIVRPAFAGCLPCVNERVAGSNTAKALESWVTVSRPVCGSRAMRNVPSTQPATENPPELRSFQKHDGRVARSEFWRAVHHRGQVSDASARQANRHLRRQITLHRFDDVESRHRPDRAVFPFAIRRSRSARAPRRRRRGQLIEAQPRQSRGMERCRKRKRGHDPHDPQSNSRLVCFRNFIRIRFRINAPRWPRYRRPCPCLDFRRRVFADLARPWPGLATSGGGFPVPAARDC